MNTVFDAEFIPFYKMVDFTAKGSLKFTQQFKQEPRKNPLSKDQIGASGWDASPFAKLPPTVCRWCPFKYR